MREQELPSTPQVKTGAQVQKGGGKRGTVTVGQ